MANPLYESLQGGNAQNAMPANQPMSMQDMMTRIKSNPIMAIRNAGFNVPDEVGANPQSIVTYLLQSGQINSPMLQRIRPMLSQMMGFV